MALTVAQMVARLTADTSGFYRGMAIANSSMIRSGGIISRVAAGAGLATLGMGIMSLRAAGNFEQSMNILQAVSGATTGQFKALRTEAIALGADMKLPNVSAKDAAEAMQELAKGGLSVKDILSATRGTLQLGLAANIGYAESAVIVARAMKAFNLEGGQATRVADLFTAAANKSTANMTDVALGFQMASAQFKAGDQTIQGLTTSLALMANAGIVGSDAGTSLKTMMNRLMAPTKKSKELMQDLGIKVYDAAGNMKPMPKLIDTFNTALAGMSKEQRNAALYTIFGSDAIRASRVMLNAGSDGWLKMQASITKGGDAQRYAEARTKGFNGALQAFGSAVETLAIQLGTAMLPAMTSVVRSLTAFVNKIDPNKIIAFFAAISGGIKWIYNLIAGSTALQAVLGGLLAGFIAFKIITGIISLFHAMTAAIMLMNAALLLNPVVLIIAGLVALGVALVILYKKSETFRDIVNGVFNAVKAYYLAYWAVAKAVFTAFMAILNSVISAVKSFASAMVATWNAIRSATTSVFNAVTGFFRTWWPLLLLIFAAPLAVILAIFNRTWGTVKEATITAFNAVKGAISSAMSAISSVIGSITRTIVGIARAGWNAVRNAIVNPLRTAIGAVTGVMNSIISAVRGFIGTALGAGLEIGRAIVSGIVSGIQGAAGAVAGAVKGVLGGALGAAKSFIGAESPSRVFAAQVGLPIAQGIIRGFLLGSTDLPAKINDRIRNSLEAAKRTIGIYMDRFKDAFSRMKDDALAAFDAMTGRHQTASEKILNDEERQRANEKRAEAVAKARAKLEEAQAGGDPAEILQAQEDLADAEWEIRRAALEEQAVLERREYDAARALQKRHLEQRLADLQEQLMKHPEQWAKINNQITSLLNSYGINYETSGRVLGTAFATGLRESRAAIVREITAIARLIRRYLRLKSPAAEGPLSDLHKWWKPFAPTLLSGLDTDAVRRGALGMLQGVGPGIGGAGAVGRALPSMQGAQAGTTVNVYNPVLLGQNREAGRMLAEVVEEHLDKRVLVGP